MTFDGPFQPKPLNDSMIQKIVFKTSQSLQKVAILWSVQGADQPAQGTG